MEEEEEEAKRTRGIGKGQKRIGERGTGGRGRGEERADDVGG